MAMKLGGGMRGVDHVAYPTWKFAETVHFYRDVLGLPLQHAILAPGWGEGVDPHPDFVHFFFEIGAEGRIAFFFYFDTPEYVDVNVPERIMRSRHVALRVDTEEELDEYQRRLEESGFPLRYRISHELIESIYVWDPNGYAIEITRPLRELTEADSLDTELSVEALIEVTSGPEPSLAKVWARKAELLEQRLAASSEVAGA